jgi:hypothetical protein
MTLRKKERILEIERGSTRSHPVEISLWKRLRTCRKTDYRMNECKAQKTTIDVGKPTHTGGSY